MINDETLNVVACLHDYYIETSAHPDTLKYANEETVKSLVTLGWLEPRAQEAVDLLNKEF